MRPHRVSLAPIGMLESMIQHYIEGLSGGAWPMSASAEKSEPCEEAEGDDDDDDEELLSTIDECFSRTFDLLPAGTR